MGDKKGSGKDTGKGGKRKVTEPFARKEWFDIKAPDFFVNKRVGKMPVNKSSGTRIAEDELKGRIIEINLADLQGIEEDAYRKIQLRVEDVQGRYCLTNFYGMDFTTDKLRSLVRKWQTLIDAHVEVRTTDGFFLRMFCIGFTKRRPNQQRKTCYAQSSQVKAIRQKMRDIMVREATSVTLKELVLKFIPEAIGKMIEKECNGIFPLTHVYIRKVKLLQSPKFDPQFLRELHDKKEMPEDLGAKVDAGAAGAVADAGAAATTDTKKGPAKGASAAGKALAGKGEGGAGKGASSKGGAAAGKGEGGKGGGAKGGAAGASGGAKKGGGK